MHNINVSKNLTLDVAKENLKTSQEQWEETKREGKAFREMPIRSCSKDKLLKKKIIKSVKKSLQ